MWNRAKTPGSEGRAPGTARYDDITELEPDFSGAGLRVAILMSRFNEDIGEGLLGACTEELRACGVAPADVLLATVPGALELPMAATAAARSGRFDAIVALGCIIRGETYHFEVVANESARGLMDVQIQTGVPIANAVLTTEDDDQALARMHEKGREAARVAIEMARLNARLQA